MPQAPLLQRPLAAALAMALAVALALLVGSGRLELLSAALVAWGVCLVGGARAALARRRLVAVLYAVGAFPTTLGVGLLLLAA